MDKNSIKRLISSIKCGVCGELYEIDSIHVLAHEGDLWFLKTFCSACHTRCLVAAVIREGRPAEVITDLTEAELDKFGGVGRLTADEVLDMHNFLKDFDGDFSRLFSRSR